MIYYTLELTEVENLALGHVAFDPLDWISNVTHERCRVAIDEIAKMAFDRYLAEGISIPPSKDAIVEDAYARGWFVKAKDKITEMSPNASRS